MVKKITKDMLISEVVAIDPVNISYILMDWGMHCINCIAAAGETLEQAMYVHGYDPANVDELISELNEYLETQRTDPSYLDELFDKSVEADSVTKVSAESDPEDKEPGSES
ncbi:MAG: DUF1858 domain-containing protein [Clostridiales bacterium]|jgi:hybrid cluster-associated redox disulfide protein|nr:DUF1858 domain-containing protein [Clostridiales bacterium]